MVQSNKPTLPSLALCIYSACVTLLLTLFSRLQSLISAAPVMVFMKGNPEVGLDFINSWWIFSCIWQRWLGSVVSSMSPGDLGFHHLLLSEVLSTLIIQRSEILCQLVVYIHLNLLLVFSFLFFNMYPSWSIEWYNVHLFSFIFTAYN